MTDPAQWADLRKRMMSAAVLIVVGALEIWLGGVTFAILVIGLTAVMIWELANMTAPARRNSPRIMAAIAAVALTATVALPDRFSAAFLMAPALALALTPRRDRQLTTLYAVAIMVAGFGLINLRDAGAQTIIWLILVVVVTDVLGYFAGRTLGGPKFWPAISPKKTWSGTVAGWLGAAFVGLGFVLAGAAPWLLVPFSVLVSFAGQMGDIWESWIKRRCTVKDSSNLIPGHGGVLDRFDALTGAIVAVMLLGLLLPLPLPAAY